MPLIPITIPPGVVKSDSEHTAIGRWVDMDKVRFFAGYPEKIGGFSRVTASTFTGYVRGARAWLSYGGSQFLLFGTQEDLLLYTASTLNTVTPFRADANGISLTNPFSTTSGLPTVTVTDTAHGIEDVGVTVRFSGASAVGGITIDGEYTVASIPTPDTFTITHTSNASGTATGGGAVTAYYEINFGDADLSYLTGWGVGLWGYGGWGSPASLSTATIVEPRWWTMDGYGEDAIVCPLNGTLYHFDTSSGIGRPSPITNAPAQVRATFTTPERFVFALGCTNGAGNFDAMTVRWPDQTDFTDWTPTSTNTANERKLQGGSRLMGGTALTSGISLVWSDLGCFAFQYTGSSVIYDSRLIGTECGLVGPHAVAKSDAMAFWMSPQGFHMYSGYVADIPNQDTISEFVFDNINRPQISKVCSYFNRDFNEVWWVYPTTEDENDSYVMVNLDTYAWATGTVSRTAIAKYQTGENRPIFFGTDGYAYFHEDSGMNDNGSAMEAFIEMAPIEISNGDQSADVFGFIPDFKRQTGDLTVRFYGKDHPRDSEMMTDTITVAETDKLNDVRVAGRQIGMKITSNTLGGDFRLGKFSLEVSGAGKKR